MALKTPGSILKYNRDCYGRDATRRRAKQRAYYISNREQILEKQRLRQKSSKQLRRESYIKNRYGLSTDQLNKLIAAQAGRCKDCLALLDSKFSIDHCHKAGHVRAILCSRCNLVRGHVKDRPSILRRMAQNLDNEELFNWSN